MKNLIQRLAPVVLAGVGLAGCSTYQPKIVEISNPAPLVSEAVKPAVHGIDLENGYFAESDAVDDEIYTLTGIVTKEIEGFIRKENNDYALKILKQTSRYRETPLEEWNQTYKDICQSIDNGDKFISEDEIQKYLENLYKDSLKMLPP